MEVVDAVKTMEVMKVKDVVIGIDVGTGSARAGIFDLQGNMLGMASHEIKIWKEDTDFVEQSSDNIWEAVCSSVRSAMAHTAVTAEHVIGLGFDATCSLVVIGEDGCPVTVSPSGDDRRNIIVWMDHRATDQAARINAGGYDVLRYVGGRISPEMQTPKILWLKENMEDTWARAAHFFDLPDYLTWRASGGALTRSLCSTVCKFTYLGHENRWDSEYFKNIGLEDLVDEDFKRLGTEIFPLGRAIGQGLCPQAAEELGLLIGTPIGTSIIDAHAGALGVMGASLGEGKAPTTMTTEDLKKRLALICGTSSCHMAVADQARDVPGIWGPYFSAMVPGMWLHEGGQSATGALIDHVIKSHGCGREAQERAGDLGISVYAYLNNILDKMSYEKDFDAGLVQDRHVLPYFHGNRSPRANPHLLGAINGLKMVNSIEDLALTYLATIQAIAYGTRHIVEALNAQGYAIDTIFACGGDCKNPIFLREHADAVGCPIVLAKEPEAVLLGSAILAAVAAGRYKNIMEAMACMAAVGAIIQPTGGAVKVFHDKKYRVFHRMYEDQERYKEIMK